MKGRMYDSMNVMNECRFNDPIVLFIMKSTINNLNSIICEVCTRVYFRSNSVTLGPGGPDSGKGTV
jgi:hypothetical protein